MAKKMTAGLENSVQVSIVEPPILYLQLIVESITMTHHTDFHSTRFIQLKQKLTTCTDSKFSALARHTATHKGSVPIGGVICIN